MERMTLEDYRKLIGKDIAQPKKRSKSTRDNELAMVTLVNRLERNGYKFGGVWRKGMDVVTRTVYQEYLFSDKRRYRADLAIPSERLLVEIHGGSWVKRQSKDGKTTYLGGAHHSPSGRRRDMEKSNLANVEGWTYLEVEWVDVKDGSAYDLIMQAVALARHPAS